ncbi:uncharacterized protein LOC6593495 isoform X3 [Drosophila persimilis]|uniref:uncharacterized protein LOC6593495 isoform X3 n=1 Tax=Drosophila persimilis TaxID=7234 RepID=UPI000F07CB6D|nr:uncharacterized protein LOC6593495 isoform X3 [Drosophila persimilis]
MEVATTNNHSQSHHHHHHHLQAVAAVAAQSHGSVGVGGGGGVSGSGSRSPFQREVREWQRIDPNTGALFSGRLEADRWINGPLNSYGKKSSSSISSQSSNNSNLTTATATAGNTHRSAGKISLHAIVGPESSSSTTSTSTPSLSLSSAWAKQQQQQADLYGQPPASSSSSRVGVSQAQPQPGTGAGAGSDADVAVVVGSTPTRLRRDLESFRHYNDDAANDDDLRLSARHQRRQQVSQSVYAPPLASIGTGLGLQRSRSISTDDLSNDWERNEEQEQEPGEWRRVSKLRRSFQSQDHYKTATKTSTITRPRPLDLPSNSVSVARMRAELENGRRLNTAMRNNHVDLAALDTILNNPQQTTKPTVAKRNTFLTAESLQEIRGKLKKLSDESLYKEDFLAYHQARPKLREQSEELHVPVQVAAPLPAPSAFRPVHNTHSLESRQRQKDTSSSEWHLRRKSYGFEKMSPPEDKSIFRVDASTDSGLGRSGEQLGNWSPTERERERSAAAAAATAHLNNGGGTIIHFGRLPKPPASPANEGELSKRHSIAVEETWRDIRKTSQVHVNGGTVATTSTSTTNSSSHLQRSSAQKRVEFCKTEVHFAAESGRVNIVETDGKPPPTNNFRRRRRTTASGPLQSLVKSASAGTNSSSSSSTSSSTSHDNVTHFGDDPQRRKTIATSTVAYRATLMDPPEVVSQPTSTSTATSSQVTVTTLAKPVLEPRFSLTESTSRNSYTSTSGVDTTDNETDELSNIRGILKNKPVKPKPYHLGENIESADVLWSVPAMKGERESPSGRDSGITSDSPISVKSVAERIRIVEQRQQNQKQPSPAGNGYSTKINVSLGTDEWPESDLPKSNVMNIALHSPRVEKPKATPPTLRIGQLIPVAKPRTLFIQPQPTSVETPGDESGSESLKIVKEARGARKLREHELSYFGVQQQQQQKQQQTKLASPCTNPRRTLPSRSKLSHSDEVAPTTTTTKWQLLNDRPDLLRHSPQDNDYEDDDDDDDDEHCYENIANELTTTFRVKSPSPSPSRSRSPGSYERKTDLQRDAQILSEMTRNADQTLKALSDEAAIKDQRRRSCSLQRRSGKPLETIDEKVNKVHNGDRQSLSVARGTFASEARRNSRQSTPSPTPTRARSSSQSSIECCPRDRSRSSSRESNTQGAGSSDDQASKHRAERLRMRTPKREKSRHEHLEHRSSRHTHASKPRSSSSATAHAAVATSSLEPKRSSYHSSHRHREVEHSSESKHSSGSRLLRSSRVSDESRSRQSALRERERERDRERSRGSEKHREELTRSRGHSSRSRPSSEQAAQAAGTRESSRPSKTRSSRSSHETTIAHKKSTSAAAKSSKSTTHKPSAITTTTTTTTSTSTNNTTATTPSTHNELTYVYVTNLAHTKSGEESEAEANEINADTDADANGDYASIEEISNASPMVPLPPPRRKRKRSLIPVPVQPTASYEYRTKLEMIPPSYSNQSTLRCRSIARHGMKKPSLKATQSTSSSFAFLPYLPAKRNSSVSHVYDNYLLYTAAGGASASASQKLPKLRPYQNNLSNDHAQLFGGTAGTGAGAATRGPGRLGGWPKRLRMRQVRSSVSTHQPFGICTCS